MNAFRRPFAKLLGALALAAAIPRLASAVYRERAEIVDGAKRRAHIADGQLLVELKEKAGLKSASARARALESRGVKFAHDVGVVLNPIR